MAGFGYQWHRLLISRKKSIMINNMADYLETHEPEIKSYIKRPKTYYQGITLVGKYTYADYLTWPNDERYELLDGVPYMMSSPNEWHQWVIKYIHRQLEDQLEDQPCETYMAPLDVRLFHDAHDDNEEKDQSDTTVVQPDIFIVCDESKIKGLNYCKGPPNLIIEVVSPSTEHIDSGKKRSLYEKAGVPEYWIITHDKLRVYCLKKGSYMEETFWLKDSDLIELKSFRNIRINFSGILQRYP